MPMNLEAVGSVSEPGERSWDSDAALRYALGVGAGQLDPTGFELRRATRKGQFITADDVASENPVNTTHLLRTRPGLRYTFDRNGLGFIEVTRGFMVIHLLNSAARQGCRIGVIEGKSTKDITTAAVKTLKSQGIHGEVTTVMVNGGAADASTSKAGDEITVTISVPASSVSWVPGARFLVGNISSQYTLRRE